MVPLGLIHPVGQLVCFGAVPGSTIQRTADRRTGSTGPQISGTTS